MEELNVFQTEQLVWAAEAVDPDAQVHSYSGRGMYGARCVAITTSMAPLHFVFHLGLQLGLGSHGDTDAGYPNVGEVLETYGMSSDNMGLGTVLYWPHVAAPELD